MSGDLYRQPERIEFKQTQLDVGLTGSVDFAVLRWRAPSILGGSWPITSFVTVTHSATLGTTFKFRKAGRWQCNVHLSLVGDEVDPHAVDAALTRDSSNNNNTPQIVDDAVLDFAQAAVAAVAGIVVPMKLTADIYITDTMAGDPTQGIVRINAADTNTGLAPTGIDANNAMACFRYIGDLRG